MCIVYGCVFPSLLFFFFSVSLDTIRYQLTTGYEVKQYARACVFVCLVIWTARNKPRHSKHST